MEQNLIWMLKHAKSNEWATGALLGLLAWFALRYLIFGFYTVDQSERAVLTTFGRAEREGGNLPGRALSPEERQRYAYPRLRVIPPGGPYFRWPWQRVHKVSIATRTVNMAHDPDSPSANQNGRVLEAVTKDQLNVGLTGQIRYRVAEENLYAYLFGVKRPEAHVMGFFVSVLRERIANFEAPDKSNRIGLLADGQAPDVALQLAGADVSAIAGVSINDLRKNLRTLNEMMDHDCAGSIDRYGVVLDASLITEIESSHDVESALAAINTAHNQVSSDISLAQASADQRIVQSKRAVEIETLKAQAEVEPLRAMANQLALLKQIDPHAVTMYVRNLRMGLYAKAERIVLEEKV